MSSTTTRDRILDSLAEILIDQGSSAVTLEAVADRAGVSKGGLLYHFPSKNALINGLVERMAAEAEELFAAAPQHSGGVTGAFLEDSLPSSREEAALYWSLIAALRSQELASPEAMGLINDIFTRWATMLREDVGDPVLAETIRLVGDGLYLTAIAELPQPDPVITRRIIDDLVDRAARARAEREPPGVTGRAGEPRRW
ncbi:TetR/AcrR family transcriptional regulator [Spiractinospora alimapuensis]|uniref:TetR/AcrR family transcriptional regulator n=1 Tax=Spiractinospora alimapuensis TaxID=2820884 RepID=UPI001F1E0CEF|nr:TetR/AcrR family transcriptional regulator [Spiractinospora alimapuensis]QVQ53494.1 TetR/AcrR family transcriptional regulator [Spiractinospora alimapuensis]